MRASLAALAVAAAVALGAQLPGAAATYGLDVSSGTNIDGFKCLKKEGFSFAIPRCYRSSNSPDPECPHTIYNAWDGGMDHVDVYFFPCPRCGDAADQADRMIDYLEKYNIKPRQSPPATYGMVWVDIEGPQYWTKSVADNRNFFSELVHRLQKRGQVVGVYTSESQWEPIMGDWAGGSHLPLWYPHYDANPSFSDYRPFGGWSHPNIKQYEGTVTVCGTGIDKNWY